jgi:hypothetical protein
MNVMRLALLSLVLYAQICSDTTELLALKNLALIACSLV